MLEGEVVLDTLDELMSVVEDGIRSVLGKMLNGQGKRAEGLRRDLDKLSEGNDGLDFLKSTAATSFPAIVCQVLYSRE